MMAMGLVARFTLRRPIATMIGRRTFLPLARDSNRELEDRITAGGVPLHDLADSMDRVRHLIRSGEARLGVVVWP